MVMLDGSDWQVGYGGVCLHCGCDIICYDIEDDVDYDYDEFDNSVPYAIQLPKFRHIDIVKGSCAEGSTGAYPKGAPVEMIVDEQVKDAYDGWYGENDE